jgi:spore coat protein U-like protein
VVALTIPNLVSLTTASAATLDFQNFTSLTQQLNIGLKSTGPVNVAINSDNNLKMVRLGASAPYPDNSQIKYFLSLRTAKIPNTPTTLTGQPRAGVGGTTWPLVLSLPNQPSGKVAGSYSDTITLTLTPGS